MRRRTVRDNDNLTTLIDVRDGFNAQLDSFAYTYDANQNKTAETRTGVMAPWGWSTGTSGYDAEDRLRAWNRTDGQLTQGWNLTLEGDWQQFTQNGTPQNRTHGPAHELTAVGGTGLAYDVKGNLTQAVTGHRYTWDFDNQLQGVDTSGDQVADVTFGYDALGRRVKKTASGATKIYVSATQPIAYSPQAGQELAEYASGAVPTSPTEKYVYGDYIDEPIWKTVTGGAVYYHANALYCVSALTNGSGAVVERYRYTPYGELTMLAADGTTVRSASNYANPYTYTGRRWDSETGLYFYRARYYHPTLGRFLARDRIERGLDSNLFVYTWNSPASLVDPTGMFFQDPPGQAAGDPSVTTLFWRESLDGGPDSIEGELGFSFKITQSLRNKKGFRAVSQGRGQTWQSSEIDTTSLTLDGAGKCHMRKGKNRIKDVIDIPEGKEVSHLIKRVGRRDVVDIKKYDLHDTVGFAGLKDIVNEEPCIVIQRGKKRLGLRPFKLNEKYEVVYPEPFIEPGVDVEATDAEWDLLKKMQEPILEADFGYIFLDRSCCKRCESEFKKGFGLATSELTGKDIPWGTFSENTFEWFSYSDLGVWTYPEGVLK